MTEQEKPDGWVAWHPAKGFLDYREGPEKYETYCVNLSANFCADSAHVRTGSQFVRGVNKKGWRIRPVKLVFLDEGKIEK